MAQEKNTPDYTADYYEASKLKAKLQERYTELYGEGAKVWIATEFLGDLRIYPIRSNIKFNCDTLTCSVQG